MSSPALTGALALSVGETRLTLWEVARLAPGDVVVTEHLAGESNFLLFNNLPIGLGEVVVIGQILGIRVVDNTARSTYRVQPGRSEALTDTLPAVVALGPVAASLEDLRGLARGSFVNLGIPVETEANAQLWVCGLPVAKGRVVVVGENMGLRVTQRLASFSMPDRVLQSGNLAEKDRGFKDYDFTRPDRFTVRQIRALTELHQLFRRNLDYSLETDSRWAGLQLALMDQCTLGEARQLLADEGLAEYRTYVQGAGSSRDAEPPRVLFEAPGTPNPWSAEVREQLLSWSTDLGFLARNPVFLHLGPASVAEESLVVDCLKGGWRHTVDFRLNPLPPQPIPPAVPEHEMVIVVTFRSGSNPRATLGLVYPFVTLEPYLGILAD